MSQLRAWVHPGNWTSHDFQKFISSPTLYEYSSLNRYLWAGTAGICSRSLGTSLKAIAALIRAGSLGGRWTEMDCFSHSMACMMAAREREKRSTEPRGMRCRPSAFLVYSNMPSTIEYLTGVVVVVVAHFCPIPHWSSTSWHMPYCSLVRAIHSMEHVQWKQQNVTS